jgi:hypothetical protein
MERIVYLHPFCFQFLKHLPVTPHEKMTGTAWLRARRSRTDGSLQSVGPQHVEWNRCHRKHKRATPSPPSRLSTFTPAQYNVGAFIDQWDHSWCKIWNVWAHTTRHLHKIEKQETKRKEAHTHTHNGKVASDRSYVQSLKLTDRFR